MKRTGKIKWGNAKIGIVVSIAIAAILYSSFSGGGVSIFEAKDYLVVYFESVNGLLKGASVRMSGIEVGTVKSIKFTNQGVNRRLEVRLNVKESVWELITTDSKVQLGTIGLLGDKYIEIFPGTPGLPIVQSGAELKLKEESGLEVLSDRTPDMVNAIDTVLTNLQAVSQKLADGKGTAGKIITDTMLYSNLVAVLDQTGKVLAEIQRNQTRILEKLGSTLDNAERLTSKMDKGDGSLGQLFNDDQLYQNIAGSAGSLDSILAKIDRGQGSAGALVNDTALYEEMRNLIVRINNLVSDIEKNPRKYFKFSVF